jgi:hypothetical protein
VASDGIARIVRFVTVVITSGQAMFKPGLSGVSYGVGPVFDRKAIGLVPTQREHLLLFWLCERQRHCQGSIRGNAVRSAAWALRATGSVQFIYVDLSATDRAGA